MIRVSEEDAILLLNKWKESGVQIGSCVFLRDDAKEEHRFWAQVADVLSTKLTLVGASALVEVPFDPETIFGYSEVSEAPAELRERFAEYEFCFTIRSKRVLALLFGQGPKKD